MAKLTDTQVKNLKSTGKVIVKRDDNGLQLRVNASGSKKWLFEYTRPTDKKRTSITLGAYPALSIQKARRLAMDKQELLADGVDPKTERDSNQLKELAKTTHKFKEVAERWFAVKKTSVSEDYAIDVWRSFESYLLDPLGNRQTAKITAPEVITILEPIAAKGALETVRRLCQRINEVMTFAVNTGVILHNPLHGIKAAFEQPKKKNLPALQPSELPEFFEAFEYASVKPVTKLLIMWQMHTMTRPNEAAMSSWAEIDLEAKQWVIPAERMKMKRDHIVPLTTHTLAILDRLKTISGHRPYLFPADRNPLSHCNSQTANAVIKRMAGGKFKGRLVAHGLRSIASTVLNEHGHSFDVIEALLAHKDTNEIRATYNRAQYTEQRRELLQWWGDYIQEVKSCQ